MCHRFSTNRAAHQVNLRPLKTIAPPPAMEVLYDSPTTTGSGIGTDETSDSDEVSSGDAEHGHSGLPHTPIASDGEKTLILGQSETEDSDSDTSAYSAGGSRWFVPRPHFGRAMFKGMR